MSDLSHILNHLGEDRDQYFGAVSPPIIQTSNFAFKTVEDLRRAVDTEFDTPIYTRGANPTVAILRSKLAALEGTEEALIFGSGIAAICAAVISQVKAGDHIVSIRNPYGWAHALMEQLLARFNVTVTFVEGVDASSYEAATTERTRLYYLESPNSWTFEVQDLEGISALAKNRGIVTILDNSYATPLFQKPHRHGIDLIAHSASKYISGHSDVVAGALCGSSQLIREIFKGEFMTLGGIISPHDAALLLRGLRTLPLRMERAVSSTKKVLDALRDHPKVEAVHFPFESSTPGSSHAKKYISEAGGLFSLSLRVKNTAEVEKFCNSLKRFLIACSWGGHESLVFPACAHRENTRPSNLVRFYIGLEDPQVLIDDLIQALH